MKTTISSWGSGEVDPVDPRGPHGPGSAHPSVQVEAVNQVAAVEEVHDHADELSLRPFDRDVPRIFDEDIHEEIHGYIYIYIIGNKEEIGDNTENNIY